MSKEIWLSIEDVAERLHVNSETVRRWLQSGEMKGYKMGKQWRIKESDVDSIFKPNTH